MLIDGLAHLIPANAAIAAVLGIPRGDGTTGVFPNTAPDEVKLPYIVYMQISRESIIGYQGVNSLQTVKFRFSCYGASYRSTKVLAEELKLLLDGYQGVLADGTNLQNTVPGIELDTSESVFRGTVYGTHLDYLFTFIDQGTGVNVSLSGHSLSSS